MENKKLTLNKVKVSQRTKQENERANAQVIKLVNNSSHLNRDDLHYRLKMLEFNGFNEYVKKRTNGNEKGNKRATKKFQLEQ